VTVVELLPQLMAGVCTANRGYLLHELDKRGVRLLNCARLAAVADGAVTVVRNVSASVPDATVTWSPLLPANIRNPLARPLRVSEVDESLAADLVVLAAGHRPDAGLYQACVSAHVAPELYNIGDSFEVGRVFDAVKAGFALGRSL